MVVAKEHIHTVVLGRPRRELPATHPTLVLLKHLKHELHSRELAAEIAVIALYGMVCDSSVRIGGDEMDDAIIEHVKKTYNLMIGERTAEAPPTE